MKDTLGPVSVALEGSVPSCVTDECLVPFPTKLSVVSNLRSMSRISSAGLFNFAHLVEKLFTRNLGTPRVYNSQLYNLRRSAEDAGQLLRWLLLTDLYEGKRRYYSALPVITINDCIANTSPGP